MTDQELRELVAGLAVSQGEMRHDLAASQKEMRDDLAISQREMMASIEKLRAAQRETDQQLRETDRQLKETMQDTDRRMKETDRQIKELGRQIGGLGRKFGGLTEGMAYPSMKKLLRERFGMEFIVPRVEITRDDGSMELDVFGYSNSTRNQAVVVEVKSRLDREGIEQMERIMARFDKFLPEHRDKRRFGIVAAVDCSPQMENQVHRRGFYLARIQDELFVLKSPESFRPRYFGDVSPATTP